MGQGPGDRRAGARESLTGGGMPPLWFFCPGFAACEGGSREPSVPAKDESLSVTPPDGFRQEGSASPPTWTIRMNSG